MFRTAVGSAFSLFGLGPHPADRAPAQPAGAESEGFEKPVVEFRPLAAFHQLSDGQGRHRTGRARQKSENVGFGGFEKFAFGYSGGD